MKGEKKVCESVGINGFIFVTVSSWSVWSSNSDKRGLLSFPFNIKRDKKPDGEWTGL